MSRLVLVQEDDLYNLILAGYGQAAYSHELLEMERRKMWNSENCLRERVDGCSHQAQISTLESSPKLELSFTSD